MAYYLQSQGAYDAYAAMGNAAKTEYLEKFLANKIKDGTVKTSFSVTKRISGLQEAKDAYQWMTKKQMIDLWGEEKTNGKLESGVATLQLTSLR